MKILLTGASSGIGACLKDRLCQGHDLVCPDRSTMDLSQSQSVSRYATDCKTDMLINCAGTGIGGKIDFLGHDIDDIDTIMRTNLIGPMLLSRCVLANNARAKIVNITSTNNNRYHANDLAYSLSKTALADFGHMLRVEYPDIQLLEIRLGLTRTRFNDNRYSKRPDRYHDIYQHPYLMPDAVVDRIMTVLFDPCVKMLEISP